MAKRKMTKGQRTNYKTYI